MGCWKTSVSICICVNILISPLIVKASGLDSHNDLNNEQLESEKVIDEKEKNIQLVENDSDAEHKKFSFNYRDDEKNLDKEHNLKSEKASDVYEGHNAKEDKLEDSEMTGFKKGHKKGHRKQGFHNSYHKDESSNKSTYFDDFNDEDDQAAFNKRLNSYDNLGGRVYKGSHNNDQESIHDNYSNRGHDKNADIGGVRIRYRDNGGRYYLDDTQKYNKYRNNYRKSDILDSPHEAWRYDYRNTPYRYQQSDLSRYHEYDRNAPLQTEPILAQRKRIITIYEDPRYDNVIDRKPIKRHEEEVELQIKPSGLRGDTYHDAPLNGRVIESSKINNLVYNYRGH